MVSKLEQVLPGRLNPRRSLYANPRVRSNRAAPQICIFRTGGPQDAAGEGLVRPTTPQTARREGLPQSGIERHPPGSSA